MVSAELLAEAMEALEEAATEERSMRIGHDVARVLHAALLDTTAKHTHAWQALGYDRAGATEPARVVQACACGEAREVTL